MLLKKQTLNLIEFGKPLFSTLQLEMRRPVYFVVSVVTELIKCHTDTGITHPLA